MRSNTHARRPSLLRWLQPDRPMRSSGSQGTPSSAPAHGWHAPKAYLGTACKAYPPAWSSLIDVLPPRCRPHLARPCAVAVRTQPGMMRPGPSNNQNQSLAWRAARVPGVWQFLSNFRPNRNLRQCSNQKNRSRKMEASLCPLASGNSLTGTCRSTPWLSP